MRHKHVFKTKDADGNDLELAVLRPSPQNLHAAQNIYNQYFRDAVDSGAMVRRAMDKYLEREKIWTKEDNTKLESLMTQMNEAKLQLARGGIKLSKARETALKIRRLRADINDMVSARLEQDGNTAEGQAENARLNYLISVCTVDNATGKNYFSDFDEFIAKMQDGGVAVDAMEAMQYILYDLKDDHLEELPENKFLKEYGFVNDKLELVDKDGNLVDELGRKVNDKGQLINDKGELIDEKGKLINEKGEPVVKFKPFIED